MIYISELLENATYMLVLSEFHCNNSNQIYSSARIHFRVEQMPSTPYVTSRIETYVGFRVLTWSCFAPVLCSRTVPAFLFGGIVDNSNYYRRQYTDFEALE